MPLEPWPLDDQWNAVRGLVSRQRFCDKQKRSAGAGSHFFIARCILLSVVGAYAGDHGFRLPNPVCMRPEFCRSRLAGARRMSDQKMKILGALICAIMMANTIQP